MSTVLAQDPVSLINDTTVVKTRVTKNSNKTKTEKTQSVPKINGIKKGILLSESIQRQKSTNAVNKLLSDEEKEYVDKFIKELNEKREKRNEKLDDDKKIPDPKTPYNELAFKAIEKMYKVNCNYIASLKVRRIIDNVGINNYINDILSQLNKLDASKSEAELKKLLTAEDKKIIDTFILEENKRIDARRARAEQDEKEFVEKEYSSKLDKAISITKRALTKHYKQTFSKECFEVLSDLSNYIVYSIISNAIDTCQEKGDKMVNINHFLESKHLDDPLSIFYKSTDTYLNARTRNFVSKKSSKDTEEEEDTDVTVDVNTNSIKFNCAITNIKKMIVHCTKYENVKTCSEIINFCESIVNDLLERYKNIIVAALDKKKRKKFTEESLHKVLNGIIINSGHDYTVEELLTTTFANFIKDKIKNE